MTASDYAIREALILIPACNSCLLIWDYAQFRDREPKEEARKKRCARCWERAEAIAGEVMQ